MEKKKPIDISFGIAQSISDAEAELDKEIIPLPTNKVVADLFKLKLNNAPPVNDNALNGGETTRADS